MQAIQFQRFSFGDSTPTFRSLEPTQQSVNVALWESEMKKIPDWVSFFCIVWRRKTSAHNINDYDANDCDTNDRNINDLNNGFRC